MRVLRGRPLLVLKGLVSLALLGWVLHGAVARDGVRELGARLGALDGRFVLLAIALQCAAVLLGTVRWRILLDAHGVRLPPLFLLRSYLVGRFVAAFTPSTAGLDAYRVLDVARATGDGARAGQAVLVEKCVGILGLALVSAVTAIGGDGLVPWRSAIVVAALAVLGASCGLALLARPQWLARLPLPKKLRAVVTRLPSGGIPAATLATTVMLGLLGHLAISATFLATGRALGVDVSSGALLAVGNAIVVATLVPISIGGVGVREGVAALLLARVGVGAGDATLVAVLGYLAGQVPALVGGVFSLLPNTRRAPALHPA